MAVLVPDVPSDVGITPTNQQASIAAASGDNFAPVNGRLLLIVTATGACHVVIKGQATVDGQTVPDRTVTIGGAGDRIIGPIPAGPFAKSDGTCDFQVDTPANLSKVYIVNVP